MTNTLEESDSLCTGLFTLVFNKQERSIHSLVLAVKQLVLCSEQTSFFWVVSKQHKLIARSWNQNTRILFLCPTFYCNHMECNLEIWNIMFQIISFQVGNLHLPVQNWGICYCLDHVLDSEPQIPVQRLFCCYITWINLFSPIHWRKMQE